MAQRKKRPDAFERVRNAGAILGEHHDNYLVIIAERGGSFNWKTSDINFAVGVAQRFIDTVKTDDRLSREEM